MRQQGLFVAYILILSLMAYLLAGLQTTLWFQIFGNTPSPALWLILIIYIALYRPPHQGILIAYGCTALFSLFSVTPIGLWLLSVLIVFGIVWFVKQRIFWPGTGYFALACVLSAALFHIVSPLVSLLLEDQPLRTYFILDRIIQILLTPLFSSPIYYLLRWIEAVTEQEQLTESGEKLI